MHPTEKVVAQSHPTRGEQNARQMATFLVGQFVCIVHGFPQSWRESLGMRDDRRVTV
jgi:hypothetical protein